MELRFRPAAAEELPAVFQLYVRRVDWMERRGLRQWNATGYLRAYPPAYFAECQAAGTLYAAARPGEPPVGAVVLLPADERWQDAAAGDALYVHNLVTDAREKGLGAFLLEQSAALALAAGRTLLRLDCAEDNPALNEYYAALGFAAAGRCQEGPYRGILREKRLTAGKGSEGA